MATLNKTSTDNEMTETISSMVSEQAPEKQPECNDITEPDNVIKSNNVIDKDETASSDDFSVIPTNELPDVIGKADVGSNTKLKKKRKRSNRPGRLSGSVPFEIHTVDAQLVFAGYNPKNSVSLLQFGGQMTTIWDAAENDDPYADVYLLKVYDGIKQCRNQLATVIQDHQATIQAMYHRDSISLTPFASQKPVVKSLWFRTQYGYLGASVIADFDELMRTVLTAHRVGVLLEHSPEAIRDEWVNRIAALFKLPFKWQPLNITRADVEANNALAEKAQQAMGKLPEPVLTKKLRSPFSPVIKAPPSIEQEKSQSDCPTEDTQTQ